MNEYLILYGADNDMWMCTADSAEDAISNFIAAEVVSPHEDENRAAVTAAYLCTPVDIAS